MYCYHRLNFSLKNTVRNTGANSTYLTVVERVRSCKDSVLWNLGFVEAYQNLILRGQGLSTYKHMKDHFVCPPRRSGSRSESKAEDSVVTSRDKKGCNEECSSGVKF